VFNMMESGPFVQGSFLGPAQFLAYCRNLKDVLNGAIFTSYVDNSYVIVTSKTKDGLTLDLSKTKEHHLNLHGMIVNRTQSEIMFMEKRNQVLPDVVEVGGDSLPTWKSIKVLEINLS